MENCTHPSTIPANPATQTVPDHPRFPRISLPLSTLLEYAGAALGIIGWFGVRQIGSPAAQLAGFVLWVMGGAILVAWGWRMKARGIVAINAVNTVMAASALAAVV